MSFRKELHVIPRNAWIVAFALYACFVILIHFLIPLSKEPGDIWTWPIAGQLAFNFLIPLIFLILVPLFGYIYGDAKRRGMRYVLWTLLAIFVPDLIGVILYFILRDPLPSDCPSCHHPVLAKFTFCPYCGASVRPVCPQCGRNIEPGWTNCGYCGTRVPVHP
ncbi:MAG: zinc ribbon domain-containing protein [Candidatus Acidiferrales bacterium]